MDPSKPLTFSERAKASIPFGQDRDAYLRKTYGDENVFHDDQGRAYVRRSPNERPVIVDEPSVSFKDIADLSGATMESLPGAAVGLLTANPFAAAGADMAGSAMRSRLSAEMSGNELDFQTAAARAGVAGLLGGTFQGAANIAASRPLKNIPTRFALRASESPEALASQRLLANEGLPETALTLGEMGGNRSILMMEQLARQSPSGADIVRNYDVSRVGQIAAKLDRTRDAYSRLSPEATGARAQSAYRQYKDSLFNQRTAAWNQAMRGVSDDAPIPTTNFRAELEALRQESDVIGGSPVLGELERMIEKTGTEESATRIRNTLSDYSKAAAGKTRIFEKLEDRSKERVIAKRLLDALGRDLDEVAEAGHPAAAAIQEARSSWKALSQEIGSLEQTQLERLLGSGNPTPEQAAERLIAMKRPSEIKNTMTLLESISPDAVQGVRANVLETYLRKAEPGASSGDMPMSPAKFVTAIKKDRGRLQAMLGPGGYSEIRRTGDVLARIADKAGLQGSQTAPLMMLWDMAKVAAGDISALPATATGLFTSKRIAEAMATPEGRQALLSLGKRGPISRQTFQGLTSLIGIWGLDQLSRPPEPEAAMISGA